MRPTSHIVLDMQSLARKNLLHDRVRLLVTLTGIVFAVVLSAVQLGLFVGFQRATSDVIRFAGADLWVMSRGVTHLENAVPFSERKAYDARAIDGVVSVQTHIIQFAQWKKPDGGQELVTLIGAESGAPLGQPWNLVAGSVEALSEPDAVIVDELYLDKLGIRGVGDLVEINNRRARVVGLTRGIRTFTTTPAVFASFKRALDYAQLPADQALYLLVRTDPHADQAAIAADLRVHLADVDVYTADAWRRAQEFYWLFGTGAGVTVLIAAVLGLLVGIVVVGQTIYAATLDHIREYGTLKAMGASNAYLYRVILEQAATSAVAGYVIGLGIAVAAARVSLHGTTAILLTPTLVISLFVLTVVMCMAASMVSINKVTRLDPAMVFRG
jgi:putative ABC transport system permease protein